jgi:hypothetical protein
MRVSRIAIMLVFGIELLVPTAASARPKPQLSREKFTVLSEALAGSAALRRRMVEQCAAKMRAGSSKQRNDVAALIDSSPEAAPQIVCERMTSAIASGRMTYQDLTDMLRRHPTVKVIRIMQGR